MPGRFIWANLQMEMDMDKLTGGDGQAHRLRWVNIRVEMGKLIDLYGQTYR